MVDLPLSCSVAAMVLPRTEQQSVDAFCKAMKRSEYYKLCGDERSLLKEGKEARKPMKKEKKRGGSRCPKKGKKRGEGTKARRKSLPEESNAQEEGQKARRRKKSEEEVAARRRNKTRDSSGRSRARKSFDATVLDAAATSEERCRAQRRLHEAAAERGVLTGSRTNEEVFMEEKRKAAARLGLLEASYRFDESKEVDPLRVAIKEGLAAGLGSEDLECPMIVLERMEASVSALYTSALSGNKNCRAHCEVVFAVCVCVCVLHGLCHQLSTSLMLGSLKSWLP